VRTKQTSVTIGQNAEKRACDYLKRQGLQLIEQNYRCKQGEIDLVMRQNHTIVFVEVRYRKNALHGSGAETVTFSKQKKLLSSATQYLLERYNSVDLPCRIDVLSLGTNNHDTQWIQNAIEKRY